MLHFENGTPFKNSMKIPRINLCDYVKVINGLFGYEKPGANRSFSTRNEDGKKEGYAVRHAH